MSAAKRISSKDMRSIHKNKLHECGIHVHFNESDITEAVAMIIGPKGSVYQDGVLFFVIKFPSNYPFSPPKVGYVSRGSIRIHPNLYTGGPHENYIGKVCISLLNTWSGPKWTTIMDISSILLSIQSLLDNNPLENEPGFSGKDTPKHEMYKEVVEYETFRTLIIKNTFDIPEGFMCFEDVIMEHYKSNRDEILESINRKVLSDQSNKTIQLSIYRINQTLMYEALQSILIDKDSKL